MSMQIGRESYSPLPDWMNQQAQQFQKGIADAVRTATKAVQDAMVDTTQSPESKASELFKEQFGAMAQDKEQFHAFMKQVYGDNYDAATAEQLRQQALKGDYSFLPDVQFVSRDELKGGNGAYNAEEGVVYIAEDLKSDPVKMQQVFVEEAGHHLDTKLNTSDAKGDEGELFRRLLSGEKLSDTEIAAIKAENDHGVITVNGKEVEVEFWFGSDFVDAVGDAVGDAVDAVGNAVSGAVNAVGDAIGSVADGVADAVGHVVNGVSKAVGGFFSNLITLQIGDAFQSLIDGADEAIFASSKRLANGLIDGAESLIKAPTYFLPGGAGDFARDFIARGVDNVRTVTNFASDMTRNITRYLTEMPLKFGEDLWEAGSKLVQGDWKGALGSFGMAFAHPFIDGANTFVDTLMMGLQGVVNIIGTSFYLQEPSRPLTDDEKAYLTSLYGDSLDVDSLRIHVDNLTTKLGMAPHTLGNDIYIPRTNEDGSIVYVDDNGNLTDQGKLLLAHESFHSWQSQNGGNDYIGKSLWAQSMAAIGGGSRNGAYEWTEAAPGTPFEDLNPEQQAALLESLATALLLYDVNGDGQIQKDELEMALNDVDHNGTTGDRVDRDGDGVEDPQITLSDEQFEYAMAAWEQIKAGVGAP